jgi:hypothetical protein
MNGTSVSQAGDPGRLLSALGNNKQMVREVIRIGAE